MLKALEGFVFFYKVRSSRQQYLLCTIVKYFETLLSIFINSSSGLFTLLFSSLHTVVDVLSMDWIKPKVSSALPFSTMAKQQYVGLYAGLLAE